MIVDVLIIDDESKARNLLETILQDNFPKINAIYQASNLTDGVVIIEQKKPNIVFLDIEMPQYSGLEILDFIDGKKVDFQLIFVTAYNQYALEAIKLSAIDYLLKPISKKELKIAFYKALGNIKLQKNIDNVTALKKVLQQFSLNKIALEIPKGISFVSHEEIYYFEADGMYTNVHFANKKYEVICKPLKHFEEQLIEKPEFYRTHRSYLVNLRHLKEITRKDGFQVILDNNVSIPITKNKQKDFFKLIDEIFNQ